MVKVTGYKVTVNITITLKIRSHTVQSGTILYFTARYGTLQYGLAGGMNSVDTITVLTLLMF